MLLIKLWDSEITVLICTLLNLKDLSNHNFWVMSAQQQEAVKLCQCCPRSTCFSVYLVRYSCCIKFSCTKRLGSFVFFKHVPSKKRKKVEKTSERMPSKLLDGIWRNKSQYMLIEHQINAVSDSDILWAAHAGVWQCQCQRVVPITMQGWPKTCFQ